LLGRVSGLVCWFGHPHAYTLTTIQHTGLVWSGPGTCFTHRCMQIRQKKREDANRAGSLGGVLSWAASSISKMISGSEELIFLRWVGKWVGKSGFERGFESGPSPSRRITHKCHAPVSLTRSPTLFPNPTQPNPTNPTQPNTHHVALSNRRPGLCTAAAGLSSRA
jgi:hypothetical protein